MLTSKLHSTSPSWMFWIFPFPKNKHAFSIPLHSTSSQTSTGKCRSSLSTPTAPFSILTVISQPQRSYHSNIASSLLPSWQWQCRIWLYMPLFCGRIAVVLCLEIQSSKWKREFWGEDPRLMNCGIYPHLTPLTCGLTSTSIIRGKEPRSVRLCMV